MKKYVLVLFILVLTLCTVALCACSGFGGGDSGENDEPPITDTGKVALSTKNASISSKSFIYDGEEKIATVVISYNKEDYAELSASNEEFELTYENTIEAGKAKVTITAKPENEKFLGSVFLEYTIARASVTITTEADFFLMLGNKNYGNIDVSCDVTITEEKTLTVSEGTSINIRSNEKHVVMKNYGTIINNGTVIVGRSEGFNDSFFYNYGSIINNERITVYGRGTLYNYNSFENNKTVFVDSAGDIYSNGIIENVTKDDFLAGFFVRSNLNTDSYTINLQYSAVNYQEKSLCPTVSVAIRTTTIEESEYEVVYENNINVGTATVIVRAKENSRKLYGEKRATFTINPVPISVNTISQFSKAIENENYKDITATGITFEKAVVRSGCKVTFKGTTTLTGSSDGLENNGNIINEGSFICSGAIDNKNSFSNTGKIYFDDTQDFSGNAITNTGTVFANALCEFVDDGLVVREQITDDGLTLSAETLFYNEESQKPDVAFDNSSVDSSEYTITYFNSEMETAFLPKSVGNYSLRLRFKSTSESLFGEVTKTFSIGRGTANVSTERDLIRVSEDLGYEKIVISNSLYLDKSKSFTLMETVELQIDEAGIFGFNNVFVNNGTVTISGSLVACCYYNEDTAIIAEIENNGEIINNGKLYLNDEALSGEGLTDNGEVYIRKSIDTLTCSIVDKEESYYYNDGLKYILSVQVLDNENVVASENYTTAPDSGDVGVRYVFLTANKTSSLIYGKTQVEYVIVPGTTTVTTQDALRSALNSKNEYNVSNWKTIIVGGEINGVKENLTVPSGVILDCQSHVVGMYTNYKIDNDGTILIRDENIGSLTLEESSKGKVVSYVSNYNEFDRVVNAMRPADIVYLKNDIITSEVRIQLARRDIIIDLCGYTLGDSSATGRVTISHINFLGYNVDELSIISTGEKGNLCNLKIDSLDSSDLEIKLNNLNLIGSIIYDEAEYENQVILTNCSIG